MKNQKEIYEALSAGKTLVWNNTNIEAKLDTNGKINSATTFSIPGGWSIKDQFADLKKAYSEGAIIEYYNNGDWVETSILWNTSIKYRIKDGISISSWNKHKEVIKAYWSGSEVEYLKNEQYSLWKQVNSIGWATDMEYRVVEETPKMYCRFKYKIHYLAILTSYIEVGSDTYKKHIGYDTHVEMKHKTFEEIE